MYLGHKLGSHQVVLVKRVKDGKGVVLGTGQLCHGLLLCNKKEYKLIY